MKQERTIYNGATAKSLAEDLNEQSRMLAGLVLEIKANPVYLLSPVLRDMLFERAQKLEDVRTKCAFAICVDIPDKEPNHA